LEVLAQLKVFMLDGIETTASLIATALHLLCQHQHQHWQQELFEEATRVFHGDKLVSTIQQLDQLVLTDAFLKETNRLFGPSPFEAFQPAGNQPETLPGGYIVQPHDMVTLNFMCCMLDEAVYTQADKFLPERKLATHTTDAARLNEMNARFLGFGGGSRVCPDMRLAISETVAALANITRNFTFTLNCEEREIRSYYTFTRKPSKLPLIFKRR
jgi:hypothetical protein